MSLLGSALTNFGCRAAAAVGQLLSDLQVVYPQLQSAISSLNPLAANILSSLFIIANLVTGVLNCIIGGVATLSANGPAIAAELCSNLGVLINVVVATVQAVLGGVFWVLEDLVC